jgi:nitroimidazol reductase NimA-like FMN-containing flavoprotein (pyridoxamine 5'-phosphate oxidase superfamily)
MLGELSQQDIDRVIYSQQVGRIGCHAGGVTYVVPVSYVYDGTYIYALSGEGMKLRMMRENPRVCFEVEHVERWYHWRTAILWGTFEELHGEDAERAYQLLHSRLTPLIEFESRASSERPLPPGVEAHEFVLYRIKVEERTGRFESLAS